MMERWKKLIIDPDPDSDQSQNIIDWFFAEGLSFVQIRHQLFKYPADKHRDRQTHMQTGDVIRPPSNFVDGANEAADNNRLYGIHV